MNIPAAAVEAEDELTLAVLAASYAPLLLLDGKARIIAASASFCHAFDIAPAMVQGSLLPSLGNGEWNSPQLGSLLTAISSGQIQVDAYEMDLIRPDRKNRCLVINARRLDYGDAEHVRILVSVTDVTDARLAVRIKEDLLRDKEVLLQELQHRVANSLQIIAGVLMQSARRVQSDETRTHLYDAHNRVMSIASLQRQLAVSRAGDVELRAYFTDLCRSIGASMIRDQNQLVLSTHVDDSVAAADVSVSLGLIVTELVINALKHGFPGQVAGNISVDYASDGPDWTLSVRDDGVGMPKDAASAIPGLGTSLVDAIANRLGATVAVTDARPGTQVSVSRRGPTAADVPL